MPAVRTGAALCRFSTPPINRGWGVTDAAPSPSVCMPCARARFDYKAATNAVLEHQPFARRRPTGTIKNPAQAVSRRAFWRCKAQVRCCWEWETYDAPRFMAPQSSAVSSTQHQKEISNLPLPRTCSVMTCSLHSAHAH